MLHVTARERNVEQSRLDERNSVSARCVFELSHKCHTKACITIVYVGPIRARDEQLTIARALSNPESGEYKGTVGSCLRVLRVSFSCFSVFSLALDPRGRLGGLGRKVGSKR